MDEDSKNSEVENPTAQAPAKGFLARFSSIWILSLNWLLTRTLYKVTVVGKENIPAEGGALIVCNHVTYVDACLLLAGSKRPIRFLMDRPIHEHPIVYPITSRMGTIPIAAEDGPKAVVQALKVAREAIKAGDLVCIFAEGQLTRVGNLLSFNRGLEQIMKGVDAPIIPAHLDRMWGSIFSFKDGKFFWKVPRKIPYPITISFGKALPASSSTFAVREAVQELSAEAFSGRKRRDSLLHHAFLTSAKKRFSTRALVESSGKELTFGKLLAAVMCFSSLYRRKFANERMVGILLPPGAAGVIANIALLAAGKIPVNLNYTAAKGSLESSIKQCKMQSIVSSAKFMERAAIVVPNDINVDNFEETISKISKLRLGGLYFLACLLPQSILKHFWFDRGVGRDDLATILFSSGSTGEPKGVMLSHFNILANIEGLAELFQTRKDDKILGVLPFFHSFGLTGTLWLPLVAGMEAIYHYNPLEAATVGELAQKHKATMLFSTPTFLVAYLRKCSKEQFSTLRFVGVGAEKLKEKLAQAFHEKFGLMPREGFGATELSPLATLNVPDLDLNGIKQIGTKLGTVGHPIPGVAIRIVDPDTLERMGAGQAGLMLVKGPNVMLGYLGDSEKTAQVLNDGWYNTGDIAAVDSDGFVTITDRMSRFSKIGGEMVPHIKIEFEIQELMGIADQGCVVTAVADEKKGEKLIVLLTKEIDVGSMLKKLSEKGLPNLWLPKPENVFVVKEIPLLGSGKMDLRAIKELAAELSQK